jgi:hypothetical protein
MAKCKNLKHKIVAMEMFNVEKVFSVLIGLE